MKSELDLIAEHLESAHFAALGLPRSVHLTFLLGDIEKARATWIRLYTDGVERDRRGNNDPLRAVGATK